MIPFKTTRNLMMASLALVTLSACGGGGSNANEIQLMNPFVGADGDNFQAMVNAYNATDPAFTIRNVAMEQDAMYTNISTAFGAGSGLPDLAVVHAERIQNFVQNDMLLSWNDLLTGFPELRADNYIQSAWEIGEIGGNRYGIPLDIHSWVMYYNIDLMEQYGVSHFLDDGILTFDEIKEIGRIMQEANSEAATIGVTWMMPNFLTTYRQMGGNITSDGFNPTLYNDTSVATLQLWRDLYEMGITNENGEDASQLFQVGQLMLIPEGIWFQNLAQTIEDFEWGMTHTPQYDPNNLVNWSSSHQFVMFDGNDRSDEQKQGILEFIDWLRENSIEWARAGQNPATLAILDEPEYQQMKQSFLLKTDEGRNSLVIFEYLFNGFVSDEINRIGFDTVFGALEVHEALDSAQRAIEDRIAQVGN